MKPKTERIELRSHPIRRGLNEAFAGGDGEVSIPKTLAIFGQIVLLYHLGNDYAVLMLHWDALALTAGLVIMPDLARMWLKSKFGDTSSSSTTTTSTATATKVK